MCDDESRRGDADDAAFERGDTGHSVSGLGRADEDQPRIAQHRHERHELPALGGHLDGVIVVAGNDVGASSNESLQRLRTAFEILQLDLDTFLFVEAELLREGRRQVDHLRLATNRQPDRLGRTLASARPAEDHDDGRT